MVPTNPGKTKTLRIRCLTFRNKNKDILPLDTTNLSEEAEFISVTYEDQKSGKKMETRSQRRTSDKILCPVRRLGRAVQRITSTNKNWSKDTLLCSVVIDNEEFLINNQFTLRLLRYACATFGGKKVFGFDAHEIGNKSLRSGAAMALFMKNHSVSKIMILGRWSSDAFLVYIRPQVLEWCNNMSESMISFESFLDVGMYDIDTPTDPRTRRSTAPLNGGRSNVMIPQFNIHD